MVSVVIPVYKVEKYLDRCINSIVSQTYSNLEIILVDDGSPDRCPEMCEAWAVKDHRIRVIHQENAGLGMARNTGLKAAAGKYICFVDSDDYIALDLVELALRKIQETGADMVLYGIGCIPKPEKDVYIGKDILEQFLPSLIGPDPKTGKGIGLTLSACRAMISMELIHRANWRFVSEREIISEDYYSMLVLYRYVNKVAVLRKNLYHYCYNTTSLSRSYRADRAEMNRRFYLECVSLCKKNSYPAEVEKRMGSPFLNATIAAMKQTVDHYNNPYAAIRALKHIIEDDALHKVLLERKDDYANPKKKVLFYAMQHKNSLLCYLLLMGKRLLIRRKRQPSSDKNDTLRS